MIGTLVGSYVKEKDGVMFVFTDPVVGWTSRQFFTFSELAGLPERHKANGDTAGATTLGAYENSAAYFNRFITLRLREIPVHDRGYRAKKGLGDFQ